MADFRKKISIEVEMVTGRLKQGVNDFRTQVGAADGAFNKMKAGAASAGATLRALPWTAVAGGAALAGGAAAKMAIDAANAAGDLEESMNKVDSVFGDAAPTVREFIENANEIGLSDRLAAEYVGTLGNVLDQLGVTTEESARLSEQTVRLAADFASFHNLEVDDVLDSMTAALRGEYDALQRVVPTINAAAVATRALEMTGKTSTASLTEQEKALAALDIMYTEAGQAAGDFERTSDGLANRQRSLKANFDDLQVAMGQLFLPVVTDVTGKLVVLSDAARTVAEGIAGLGDVLSELPDVPEPLAQLLGLEAATEGLDAAAEAGHGLTDALFGAFGAANNWTSLWSGDGGEAAKRKMEEQATAAEGLDAKLHNLADDALAKVAREQENVTTAAIAANQAWADAETDLESATEAMAAAEEEATALAEAAAELSDAMVDLAGGHLSAQEAGDKWAQTLADLEQDLADAAEGADDLAEAERNQRQVMRDATESAVAKADSMRGLAEGAAEAEGATLTVEEAMRVWNDTMLQSAADADGPLRDSILDYIAVANGIPESKVTEIEAAIAEGDLEEAKRLLDEAVEARDAPIIARVDVDAANAALLEITKTRYVDIISSMKGNIPVETGSLHIVDAETGAETGLVVPDDHTLEINVETDVASITSGWQQQRAAIEAAKDAAKEAEVDYVDAAGRLKQALDDLATLYDFDLLSRDDYLTHLRAHQAGYEKFSLEWLDIQRQISNLEKEHSARQDAIRKEEQKSRDEALEAERKTAEEAKAVRDKDLADREKYATGIAEAFTGAGDLVSEFAGAEEAVTAGDVHAFLGDELKRALLFSNVIGVLRNRGDLPAELIEAILKAGPERGFPIASALFEASSSERANIALLLFQMGKAAGITGEAAAKRLFPGLARGGTSPGGVTLVGEEGPELVDLPSGAQVTNAANTRRRLNGNGHTSNVTINVARPVSAAEIVRLQRQYERRNGAITLS